MNKGKGINNLKYFFLSLFLFSLFLLFAEPVKAGYKSTYCYDGTTQVGYLYSNSMEPSDWYPWLVSGSYAFIGFQSQDVANANEVFMKIGNGSWLAPTYKDIDYYEYRNYPVGNEPCGNSWVNVTWRSIRDGQMHYCSLVMKKYTGNTYRKFINNACLSTQTGCIFPDLSDVRRAMLKPNFFGQLKLSWTDPDPATLCDTKYTAYYSPGSAGRPSGSPYCWSLLNNYPESSPELSGGQVVVKISPPIPPGSLTGGETDLVLYKFISNTTCGSGYSGGIPATPTPTPISCPLAIQSMSFSGSGTPLINDYNTTQYKGSPQYTVVNSTKTGKITKAEIYGTLDRDIPKGGKVLQCKITDSTGTTTLGESATNNGAFTKGVSWFPVTFTTPVNLVNGTSYRLYCKVNNLWGGGSIYWLDDWRNRTTKAYRLYMCE